VDTRIHFVKNLAYGEGKILDVEFVRSDENQGDTFTKNATNDKFWTLTSKYMTGD
jgi:hypothetical protein